MFDICIVGAGASGLAAAVTAAREAGDKRILVLEKKEAEGKKLAATGNGKCNITNIKCPGAEGILEFFGTLGIITRTDEEGRVYPYCTQARDVVYALKKEAERLGVEIRLNQTVEKVEAVDGGFHIHTRKQQVEAKKLLIASGGKAAPQFGTSGDGYAFAKALGHTVTRLAPVLTGIDVKEDIKTLRGNRVKALVKLFKDGKEVISEYGEVQFNEDGISGICVMNLSRYIKLEEGETFSQGISRYSLKLDLVPEMEAVQLENLLEKRAETVEIPEDLLLSIVPEAMRKVLAYQAEITPDNIQKTNLCKLVSLLKDWPLSVAGTKGWKFAQATAGGVSIDEIDMETMASTICEGLYFSGEIIDYDGPCGGYNLQNAWETGIKAGKAMADVL